LNLVSNLIPKINLKNKKMKRWNLTTYRIKSHVYGQTCGILKFCVSYPWQHKDNGTLFFGLLSNNECDALYAFWIYYLLYSSIFKGS